MGYFKGKQFERDIILVAISYYCRFSLSYRDVSEILRERGIIIHIPNTVPSNIVIILLNKIINM
ncbi:hypothetical protein BT246_67010 (plasmid) [Bacillus thuringiensis]|uniref:Transposase n=1 Tax=Bacillus thuringiensis TaxID=1428 RepID=A0A9W3X4F2_BACTU|nr:hypothetical protein BT246_67010 [Bacillus thuringiensis]